MLVAFVANIFYITKPLEKGRKIM